MNIVLSSIQIEVAINGFCIHGYDEEGELLLAAVATTPHQLRNLLDEWGFTSGDSASIVQLHNTEETKQ